MHMEGTHLQGKCGWPCDVDCSGDGRRRAWKEGGRPYLYQSRIPTAVAVQLRSMRAAREEIRSLTSQLGR